MKTETISDMILDLMKTVKVVTSDRIAKELNINKKTAAGHLSQMKKDKLVVSHNGLWALNHVDLNMAESILNNQQTTVNDLIGIMNSIVKLGKNHEEN